MTDKQTDVILSVINRVLWTAGASKDNRKLLANAISKALNAAPTPPNTITIPVDEYEGLKKDAERYRWLTVFPEFYSSQDACLWVLDNMEDDLKLVYGVK